MGTILASRLTPTLSQVYLWMRPHKSARTMNMPLRTLLGGVLLLGSLSIGLVVYSQWLSNRDFHENAAVLRMIQTVAQDIAVAHLWLEEGLAGDASVDVNEDVSRRLHYALETVRSASLGEGKFKSFDFLPGIEGDLHKLGMEIEVLEAMASRRWDARDAGSTSGDPADQVFGRVLNMSGALAQQIDDHVAADQRKVRHINAAMLAILLAVFSTIAAMILTNRKEMEQRAVALEHLVRERTASLEAREPVSRQHEPRDTHAHEWCHRHGQLVAAYRPGPGAARICTDNAQFRALAVESHQFDSGFLQDRGGQDKARVRRVLPAVCC